MNKNSEAIGEMKNDANRLITESLRDKQKINSKTVDMIFQFKYAKL